MLYSSTRGGDRDLHFRDTVLTGLARDGGLILPQSVPDISADLPRLAPLRYQDLAFEVMRLFADDIPEDDLRAIIGKSYATFRDPLVTPLVPVGDLFVLEHFHGPTLAFKDLALQFLGNLFEYILSRDGRALNIVAATSGDTGSAAIHGVRGKKGVSIFVLHPEGRVSPVQALQMTSVLDANVHNLAVAGTFDDCQGIVKSLFADLPFKDAHSLGAVNSINWARVLAQVVYYFFGAFRALERTGATEVDFTVHTGNFGDVFAGYIAAKMGLPIRRLILATNENDILDRCFKTGTYALGGVSATLSPSMDIQMASNFERWLYYFYGEDPAKTAAAMASFKANGSLRLADGPIRDRWLSSGRADTAETLEAIRSTWREYGYLLDPHTAVGVAVARKAQAGGSCGSGIPGRDGRAVPGERRPGGAEPPASAPQPPMVCLSTAHPAKFGAAILRATGEDLAHHPAIDALQGAPTRVTHLPADREAVAAFVASQT
ncbi:MAG: threonine synthase [Kiritimatiellae bacterium]|nr:threonine synthase [Kiritimatiellia bacterium]